jgi:molybdate transport system ATP-binding protein
MLDVNVKKRFAAGEVKFQLDVEFSLGNGITVLTGASGAGKTTVLRLIAGALTPDEGTITLDGDAFFDSNKRINLPIQKRRVGFVFQDYLLFQHLTGEQNIAYGMKAIKKKADEFLALFHIEHVRDRLPSAMSGGEQQRVALARALASDPAIVLFDEPLSAVDVETRAHLLGEIENAQRQANIPFLYVTHTELEAERLGTQRLRLVNGRNVEPVMIDK